MLSYEEGLVNQELWPEGGADGQVSSAGGGAEDPATSQTNQPDSSPDPQTMASSVTDPFSACDVAWSSHGFASADSGIRVMRGQRALTWYGLDRGRPQSDLA